MTVRTKTVPFFSPAVQLGKASFFAHIMPVSELIGYNTSLRIMQKLLITDLISCNFWLCFGDFVSAG